MDKAYTLGTIYNTTITNRATVSGDNLTTSISVTNKTNVMQMIGASWANGADTTASAPSVRTLTTYFTNVGNEDGVTWRFGVVSTNWSTATLGAPWTWVFLTNTTTVYSQANGNTNTSAFTYDLNMGNSVQIDFRVYVPGTAITGVAGFGLIAVNTTGGQNVRSYISDDGITRFGGAVNIGFGENVAGRVDLYSPGADNYLYEITVSAPIIHITKLILGIATGDVFGPNNIAIPGATITNAVYVTNVGSGNATALVIRDFWNSSYVSNGNMGIIANGVPGATWVATTNYGSTYVQWSNSAAGNPMGQNEWTQFRFTTVIK
jgi:hypothetical protein